MKNKNSISHLMIMLFLLSLTNCSQKTKTIPETVTDIDGNIYNTITIGTQVWMAENLKTTRYQNGDPIPNISDNVTWGDLKKGAYCNYNNDANNSITYGRLYNWYAVNDDRKMAPKGWHVPTDAEWDTLIIRLGGDSIAGDKLKETGITHWYKSKGATNESHFTALPSGDRMLDNGCMFSFINYGCVWWSSTEHSIGGAWDRELVQNSSKVWRNNYVKGGGHSVRCLMDQ